MKLKIDNSVRHIHIDASGYNYGRLCSLVAYYLRGKDDILFNKFSKKTSIVEISNISKVNFSKDNKLHNIKFYSHSGYMGGLKERTLGSYISKGRIRECFRISVRRMLSKTNGNRKKTELNLIFKDEK